MERQEARRRSLYLTLVAALVVWLAYLARAAVVPLLVALLCAYVLAPLVAVLEKRGMSRIGAVTGLFLAFFGTLGLAIAFGVPPVLEQGRALLRTTLGEQARTLGSLPLQLQDLPAHDPPLTLEALQNRRAALDTETLPPEEERVEGNYERKLREAREADSPEVGTEFRRRHQEWKVGHYEGRTIIWDDRDKDDRFDAGYLYQAALGTARFLREKFRSPEAANAAEDIGTDALPLLWESLAVRTGSVARGALGVLGTLFQVLSWIVIVPLYAFFFLMHLEDVWTAFQEYLPGRYRDRVVRVLHQIHRMLIGFFRGRLLTMILKGVFVGVLLALVGAPFWPVLGFAAGVLTIIPAAGPLLAAVPGIALAYAEAGSMTALLAAAVYGAAEIVEGYVLIPQMVGKEVGLHPLAVVAAIIIGGALLGLLGVVLAIPLAAGAKIVWTEFVLPDLRAKAAEEPTGPVG